MAGPLNSYTRRIEPGQATVLEGLLRGRGYRLREVPHARFAAEGPGVNVVMYQSGKLVVQGKATREFVEFVLEPEVLGVAELGYETVLHPELKLPRIGVDESGKGDLFGPLCVAGVYVNEAMIGAWTEAGVRDSKAVGSDRRVGELADVIRRTSGCVYSVVPIGNAAYNRLHAKLGSVNRILAWGHARVIENLLSQRGRMNPPPVRAVIDQFAATQSTVTNALMAGGRELEVIQRHKAESDLAVAAASILARDEFVRRLRRLGEAGGVPLPKGAGPEANRAMREWVDRHGWDRLGEVTKLHFRNVARGGAEGLSGG
jgi:ribonuclease HIII